MSSGGPQFFPDFLDSVTHRSGRVLVTASRTWVWAALPTAAFERIEERWPGRLTMVHGAAGRGGDAIARNYVARHAGRWDAETHPADWRRLRRRAGPVRNAAMVAAGADVCLAFLCPCVAATCVRSGFHYSHGASRCAELAERAGIPTFRWFR